jgi:hypothetical protein
MDPCHVRIAERSARASRAYEAIGVVVQASNQWLNQVNQVNKWFGP